jgi:hypothetical protein
MRFLFSYLNQIFNFLSEHDLIRWPILFLALFIICIILNFIIYFPLKNNLTILNLKFDSQLKFRLFLLGMMIPVLALVYLFIWNIYDIGYNWFNRAWILSLTFVAADRFAAALIIWLFFKEMPKGWVLVGLIVVILGAAISILGKAK